MADRAAKHVTLPTDDFRFLADWNLNDETITELVDSLRRAGAQDQVTVLVDRLPSEGLFDTFRAEGNNRTVYRFGRNPDGSPAEAWGWEDLA